MMPVLDGPAAADAAAGDPTVIGLLARRAAATPDAPAHLARGAQGAWSGCTWAGLHRRVLALAGGLAGLGLEPGDRVALLLPTLPVWELCHLAVLAAGGSVLGCDAQEGPESLRRQWQAARPRLAIVADAAGLALLAERGLDCRLAVVAEGPAPHPARSLAELGAEPRPGSLPAVRPGDEAAVFFTSGSTGRPRGIAYTHRQVCLASAAILRAFPALAPGARLACWLPPAGIFQRIANLCALQAGAEIRFVEDPRQIVARIAEIRPTILVGVPRFFDKVLAAIDQGLGARPWPVRWAARGAWRLATAAAARRAREEAVPPALHLAAAAADRLVLRGIRARFGDRPPVLVSGSAPLALSTILRLQGLGLRVVQGYALSENAVPIAIGDPDDDRPGSVGRPCPGNQVRIAADGELLVRGPGLASGYLDGDGAVRLDGDGYLRTGDLARLDERGFLWLIGRSTEMFKTSTGRRIEPVPIEERLRLVPGVAEAVVVGRSRPYLVALLTLGGGTAGPELERRLEEACAGLPPHHRPALALVLAAPFTVAGGELTANLKLRRGRIEEKHRAAIYRACALLAASPAGRRLVLLRADPTATDPTTADHPGAEP